MKRFVEEIGVEPMPFNASQRICSNRLSYFPQVLGAWSSTGSSPDLERAWAIHYPEIFAVFNATADKYMKSGKRGKKFFLPTCLKEDSRYFCFMV